jgi:tripartite-type tricarboxylate transporter receptor subunit TctC
MRNTLIKQGMDPVFLGPQQLADLIRRESASWAKVIKTAGIRVE